MKTLKNANELRKMTDDFIKTVDVDKIVQMYMSSLAIEIEKFANEGEHIAMLFVKESYRVKIYFKLIEILKEKGYNAEIIDLKDGRTSLKVSW
jgi:replicative superfamily II helicase